MVALGNHLGLLVDGQDGLTLQSASGRVDLNWSWAEIRLSISFMVWTLNMTCWSSMALFIQWLKVVARMARSKCSWLNVSYFFSIFLLLFSFVLFLEGLGFFETGFLCIALAVLELTL